MVDCCWCDEDVGELCDEFDDCDCAAAELILWTIRLRQSRLDVVIGELNPGENLLNIKHSKKISELTNDWREFIIISQGTLCTIF
jgi:hypothetical protein